MAFNNRRNMNNKSYYPSKKKITSYNNKIYPNPSQSYNQNFNPMQHIPDVLSNPMYSQNPRINTVRGRGKNKSRRNIYYNSNFGGYTKYPNSGFTNIKNKNYNSHNNYNFDSHQPNSLELYNSKDMNRKDDIQSLNHLICGYDKMQDTIFKQMNVVKKYITVSFPSVFFFFFFFCFFFI